MRPHRLALVAALTLAAALSSPAAAAPSTLGPGTRLSIEMAGATYTCTAGFVFQDTSGNLYLSTAGHCLIPEGRTATHGPGADYNAANTQVYACVSSCDAAGLTGTLVALGPVGYARSGDPWNDFGLVRIPSSLTGFVSSTVPFCGGPQGTGSLSSGEPFCFYAQGAGRLGVGTGSTASSWSGVGPFVPGDSGAPVVEASGLHAAIGIVSAIGPGGGPTVARMQSLAATQAGLTITPA